MSYAAVHYKQVLDAVVSRFSMDEDRVPDWQWLAWRSAIKRLFDQDLLISEILGAIDEAAEKRKWPDAVGFWKRVEDVCLKNRREQRRSRVDGTHSIRDILERKHLVV